MMINNQDYPYKDEIMPLGIKTKVQQVKIVMDDSQASPILLLPPYCKN